MEYWRTPLVSGGYVYARVPAAGYRCERLNPGSIEWMRDDYLWSEIRNTGAWERTTADEVKTALAARTASASA